MSKEKLYFKSIDHTTCHSLEWHLEDAKLEDLQEITLVEAIPDNDNPDYVWCTHYENSEEKNQCRKSFCPGYESKSGRGVCEHRGNLYTFGEEVKFDVNTKEIINEKTIENHREKFPLPIEEINAYSSFAQILGRTPKDYTPDERKTRWIKNGEELKKVNPEAFDFYFTESGVNEVCLGCENRIQSESWCKWAELPCNYNPVLNNAGLACIGMGFKEK